MLVSSCDCLPVQKLMMAALSLTSRKVIHSMQNPIGFAVRKLGQHNQQVNVKL